MINIKILSNSEGIFFKTKYMKILNVDFSEVVIWSEETLLTILQKANPTKTENELKTLIKASKLVKDELQPTASKSAKREKPSESNNRNTDNIQ